MAGPFLDIKGLTTFRDECDKRYLPQIGPSAYVTQTDKSKPYLLVASYDTTGSWSDASVVFAVNRGYDGGGSGLLDVTFRSGDLKNGEGAHCSAAWSARNMSMATDCFYVGCYADKTKAYADLYFKAQGNYDCIYMKVLTNCARGTNTFNKGPWVIYSHWANQPADISSSYLFATPNRRTYTTTGQSFDYMAGGSGSSASAISNTYINGLF